MARPARHRDRWIVRASVAGLVAVLCFLAGFSIVTERSVAAKSRQADRATRLSATYQDARHWVAEEKSEERRTASRAATPCSSPTARPSGG